MDVSFHSAQVLVCVRGLDRISGTLIEGHPLTRLLVSVVHAHIL